MKKITPICTGTKGILIRFTVEGARYSFAPVLNGQYENHADLGFAWQIAKQISTDLQNKVFDETLEKYKPKSKAEIERIESSKDADLKDLWVRYTESRKNQVAETTYKDSYPKITNAIEACPYKSLSKGSEIMLWVLKNKPSYFASKILQQLNACCKWAIELEFIPKNPFCNYKKFVNTKTANSEADIDPFEDIERNSIVCIFQEDFRLKSYFDLVQFLFYTGCRPSEALALTWIDVEDKHINFNKAYVNGILKNRLKTQEKRKIKISRKIGEILNSRDFYCKRLAFNKYNLVFPSPRKNEYVDWSNFSANIWPKALSFLPEITYRPAYQMRHTFITLSLRAGASVQDVARHCGNSPDTIYKHYAGASRDLSMPEI
jgi:integrase